jgi:hypothetical protein
MSDKTSPATVSRERVDALMRELHSRLMLVTDPVLNHLQSHGVIGLVPAPRDAGCCRPDGGTCCVNKK